MKKAPEGALVGLRLPPAGCRSAHRASRCIDVGGGAAQANTEANDAEATDVGSSGIVPTKQELIRL